MLLVWNGLPIGTLLGEQLEGTCSTPSLFSCMSISPPFSQTKGKKTLFPSTGVLSIGHKPLDVTTARQKRLRAYDLLESSHSTKELTERLHFADAELGHLLHLAPDQHTRLLPFAFYR